ncbi:DUF3299 domain-containing protein [Ramlibacter aurantiacus]|nr:DUF3299 domain-containing protein [Ramlibacter aurantiacus]
MKSVLGAGLLALAAAVGAQPTGAFPAKPVVPGTGAGVHSPDSPIPPLPERSDALPWSLLTAVKHRTENKRVLPLFSPEQLALDGKPQRLQGFMMPLQPGEKVRHFLLSSVPLTCSFCVPGGPESMVEVRTRTPVAYTPEPVLVEGRFHVLRDDPMGLFYRMTDAAPVR